MMDELAEWLIEALWVATHFVVGLFVAAGSLYGLLLLATR